jgi:hypothetical protein
MMLKAWPRKRTDEERARDDANLRASGEPLAPEDELFKLIPGLKKDLLHQYIGAWDPVYKYPSPPPIRYISSVLPKLFCIRDVREAFERDAPRRAAEKARRIREGEERCAREHEAAVARKALRGPKKKPAKPTPQNPAPLATPFPSEPEVIIVRRRIV